MISHFSKLSSHHSLTTFKLLFFFSFHLIVLLAFPLIQFPASTFIHSSSKSVFHPHFISSPLFHVSSFTFPIHLVHPQVFFYSWPVSTLCFLCLSATFFPLFWHSFYVTLLLCFPLPPVYHFFPPLYSVPPFFLLPSLLIPSCLAFSSPLCFRLTVPSSLWNNSRGCLRLLPTTVADCINIACHCLIDHRNARNTELATRQVSG